jgi:UDP:flavonoid glycosyltransferase YjiC (YdhE family)
MKITLAPFGTASDVLPMLALAKTLQSRGHVVTICAAEEFRSLLYKAEVPMVSSGQTYRRYLECEGNFEDATSDLVALLHQDMATHFVALRDATRDADAIVGGRLQVAGRSLAEQRQVPYFYAVTTPGNADPGAFPVFGVPRDRAHKRRNKRIKEWDTHVLCALNREREISHLPPVTNLFEHLYRNGPVLFAVDPAFLPSTKPLPNQISTGFWYMNENFDLEPEIESYLSEGKAPVYIAPFRMKDQQQISSVCETLTTAGHRVVLGHGWDGMEEKVLPSGIRFISSLSYAHLFSKMSAIVHGGAPDIAMHAIRSNIPQIIAPYTVEQSYWAEKCHSLGASPAPVLSGDLNQLKQAIQWALQDRTIADRLQSLSSQMQDGTQTAADAIEEAALK